MAEGLKITPIVTLDKGDLRDVAGDIHNLVKKPENQELLVTRHLYGVVARHSVSRETSVEKLENHVRDYGTESPDAVVQVDGKTVGMASAQRGIVLRRQRTGLPPPFSKIFEGTLNLVGLVDTNQLEQRRISRGHNVAAYAFTDDYSVLEGAYAYLRDACMASGATFEPWTIEPFADAMPGDEAFEQRVAIGAAIRGAGYEQRDTGYFDDQESNVHPVLPSALYVAYPFGDI
jgi:hypothetical protein